MTTLPLRKVELYGGPLDGNVVEIDLTANEIRFPLAPNISAKFFSDEDGSAVDFAAKIGFAVYRMTDGKMIYNHTA